jgi:hypothetical protein
MKDTSPEIRKKQIELFLQKTPEERFLTGAQMIDDGRTIIESSILNVYPNISEIDLKTEVLKRYYSKFFKPSEMAKIVKSMIIYYNNHPA